jgi:hypothetical protein
MCATYCRVVDDCAGGEPGCESDCRSDLDQCSQSQREAIANCLRAIDHTSCVSVCYGFIGFSTCVDVGLIQCWDPPVTSC